MNNYNEVNSKLLKECEGCVKLIFSNGYGLIGYLDFESYPGRTDISPIFHIDKDRLYRLSFLTECIAIPCYKKEFAFLTDKFQEILDKSHKDEKASEIFWFPEGIPYILKIDETVNILDADHIYTSDDRKFTKYH